MVYCNKCEHEFNPNLRAWDINKDVEEIFFNCPSCHERYTAYYTNDKIKQLQGQLRRLQGRRNGKTFIKKQIEAEMNRLEKLYGTQ